MRRMPIPDRRIFHPKDMHPQGIWGIRPSFPGLSPCPGQVAYVLLTSAPVAAKGIATPALPLDLHVLSLSLAFILSQDQTLRCVYLVCLFFSEEKGTSATHKPEAVPLRLHALVSLVSMTAVMLSPVTIGILTGDPRNHLSLSLTCLSISSPQTSQ